MRTLKYRAGNIHKPKAQFTEHETDFLPHVLILQSDIDPYYTKTYLCLELETGTYRDYTEASLIYYYEVAAGGGAA